MPVYMLCGSGGIKAVSATQAFGALRGKAASSIPVDEETCIELQDERSIYAGYPAVFISVREAGKEDIKSRLELEDQCGV